MDPSGGYIPGATVILFADDHVRVVKTDDGDGNFMFFVLGGPARFLEASAKGFMPASVPTGDKRPDELLITLAIGRCTQCGPLVDTRDRSVQYEERSGREQLSGTVGEYQGSLLAHVSIVLGKADLTGPQAAVSFATYHNFAMRQRGFEYSFAAETTSDEKGKFQFAGLEPGWYSLEANYNGYYKEMRNFWIARETLTRPSPIEMVRPGGASPMRPLEDVTVESK